jgi:uncharacterized protein (DUF697 family)
LFLSDRRMLRRKPMSEKDLRATEIIKRYAAYSAGAGLIPVPALDIAAIGGVQLKMIAELAKVYDVPFENDRVRPIVSALIGGYASAKVGSGLGASLLKSVPLFGQVLGMLSVPAFGAGVTWAIGKVFVRHFASGGTFLDFDPDKVRAFFKGEHAAGAAAA